MKRHPQQALKIRLVHILPLLTIETPTTEANDENIVENASIISGIVSLNPSPYVFIMILLKADMINASTKAVPVFNNRLMCNALL